MKKLSILAVTALVAIGGATSSLACDKCKGKGEYKGKMFEMMDINKDGVITKAEALSKAEEKFDKTDTNGDGTITKEETKEHHKKMKKERKEDRKDRKDKKED